MPFSLESHLNHCGVQKGIAGVDHLSSVASGIQRLFVRCWFSLTPAMFLCFGSAYKQAAKVVAKMVACCS